MLSRSRDWLRLHLDDGRRAFTSSRLCNAFPSVPPPDSVHVLVVTEERTSIVVDIIVTCFTGSLILDGLYDLGYLNSLALKRTPVLYVSTIVLLFDYGLSGRTEGIKSFRSSIPSPSAGVSSSAGVVQVVNHARNSFHSGRPAGNFGPPVSLFNPLGLFNYHLCHLDDEFSTVDLPLSLIRLTPLFIIVAANSYPDKATRRTAIKGILDGSSLFH